MGKVNGKAHEHAEPFGNFQPPDVEEEMPPNTQLDRLIEHLERRAEEDRQDRKAMLEEIRTLKTGSETATGKRGLYLPIAAAVLISVAPQMFNGVWWTSSKESEVTQLRKDLAAEVEARKSLLEDVKTGATWQERFRLNMAERGYVIDPISAAITDVKIKKGK